MKLEISDATFEDLERIAKNVSHGAYTYSPSDVISVLIGYYEAGPEAQ
jgi:hypothetical protein